MGSLRLYHRGLTTVKPSQVWHCSVHQLVIVIISRADVLGAIFGGVKATPSKITLRSLTAARLAGCGAVSGSLGFRTRGKHGVGYVYHDSRSRSR
jgi:hypothetical protein